MSSDYDIEMSTDDTLELDTIIEKSNKPINPITRVETSVSYDVSDLDGIQTNTAIFDPPESGEYDIHVNGQVLSINVKDASTIPESGVARWEWEQDVTDSWFENDGTDNTSTGYATDSQFGSYAKSFDGSDDYVTHPTVSIGDDFTLTGWFKADEVTNTGNIHDLRDGYFHDVRVANGELTYGVRDASKSNTEFVRASVSTGTW